VFDQEIPRQYDGLKRRKEDEKDENERVYTTREGDVLLTLEGKTVWVSEGFELPLARKLRASVDEVNVPLGHGPVMTAKLGIREQGLGIREDRELVGGLSHWMSQFGMMRVVLR
jgi:hypothetical protein